MKVPLTILDHLERAELVYGAREPWWSTSPTSRRRRGPALTGARMGELARAQACGLDQLGVGPGERVAMVSQNSARLLTALLGRERATAACSCR